MKKNLKVLARNSILMITDDELRDRCKKIMSINPNACPLIDGDASKLVKSGPNRLKALLKNHLKQLES